MTKHPLCWPAIIFLCGSSGHFGLYAASLSVSMGTFFFGMFLYCLLTFAIETVRDDKGTR